MKKPVDIVKEAFTAKSKASGRVVNFASQQNRDTAIKSGEYEETDDTTDSSTPTKPKVNIFDKPAGDSSQSSDGGEKKAPLKTAQIVKDKKEILKSKITNWSDKEKAFFRDGIHKADSPERRNWKDAITDKAKGAIAAIKKGAKHEVEEFKTAGGAVKSLFNGQKLDEHQKKALKAVAIKVATTALFGAATGGAGHGALAFGKHVAMEFIPHVVGETILKGVGTAALFAGEEEEDVYMERFMAIIADKMANEKISPDLMTSMVDSYNANKEGGDVNEAHIKTPHERISAFNDRVKKAQDRLKDTDDKDAKKMLQGKIKLAKMGLQNYKQQQALKDKAERDRKAEKMKNEEITQLSPDQAEMVNGIIDMLLQIKDIDNRMAVAQDQIKKFKEEEIQFNYAWFLSAAGLDNKDEPVDASAFTGTATHINPGTVLTNIETESANEEKVYIDFLNKAKGFKPDRIRFNSYEDAVKWARKNFDKFDRDMIKYESVNEDNIPGGLAKGLTLNDIAEKHGISVDMMVKEFKKGIKVEMEHTTDVNVAKEIALDHLFEDPKYYDKLATIENMNNEINEAFKHIIHVDTPTQVVSKPVAAQILALAKKGVRANEIGLEMGFVGNAKLATDTFQKVKNKIYFELDKRNESMDEAKKKIQPKDDWGVRIVQAINNNVSGLHTSVVREKRDINQAVDAFGTMLKNAIKEALKHKYKPNVKVKDADVKLKTFISELKKFEQIVNIVIAKPTKVGVTKLDDAWRSIWNHKFGGEIAYAGDLFDSIVEGELNEVKYPTDLNVGSVIMGQGFTMLKGIEGGKYYKVVAMDDISATLVPSDKSGNVKGSTKVRHKLDSIEGGIKTAKRGDENGIVVIKESILKEDVYKTILYDNKHKMFFGLVDDETRDVKFIDAKTWLKSTIKDKASDNSKEEVLKSMVRKISQFNRKVEFNMWVNKEKPTWEQKIKYLLDKGLAANVNRGGIRVYESVNEGKKAFKVNPPIGSSKYSISFHDGVKKHNDGSDFWDIKIFKNKADLENGIKDYKSKGFIAESVNEERILVRKVMGDDAEKFLKKYPKVKQTMSVIAKKNTDLMKGYKAFLKFKDAQEDYLGGRAEVSSSPTFGSKTFYKYDWGNLKNHWPEVYQYIYTLHFGGLDGATVEGINEEKPGLWANIRAKQARGEEPAHGNSQAHKDAVKAGKEINKDESVTEAMGNDKSMLALADVLSNSMEHYDEGDFLQSVRGGQGWSGIPGFQNSGLIPVFKSIYKKYWTVSPQNRTHWDLKDWINWLKPFGLQENWDSEMEPVEESTPGEQIQNLNNRLTKLRQDMAAAKSPEAKNVIQAKMKNALQKLSDKKKNLGIKKP